MSQLISTRSGPDQGGVREPQGARGCGPLAALLCVGLAAAAGAPREPAANQQCRRSGEHEQHRGARQDQRQRLSTSRTIVRSGRTTSIVVGRRTAAHGSFRGGRPDSRRRGSPAGGYVDRPVGGPRTRRSSARLRGAARCRSPALGVVPPSRRRRVRQRERVGPWPPRVALDAMARWWRRSRRWSVNVMYVMSELPLGGLWWRALPGRSWLRLVTSPPKCRT